MLKKRALNRIFLSSVTLFIALILYTFTFIKYEKPKNIVNNVSVREGIYTLNNDNYVSKGYIYVNKNLTCLERVKLLIDTMIEKNNKNALLPSYFKPILPQNTKLLNAELSNKIIKLNFSVEFLSATNEQIEKMIEAITYTLTDLDDINGVELYINGELLKYIPHTNKNLPTILTKDYGINKKYEISSNKDINKVVLYYLGFDNNFIPITKYVNDKREKLEIIVEDLSSNYIFYENLASLLNYNLKLIDYKMEDKTITMTFNSYIYDDVSKKVVKDEVINALTYSVFATYDVEKVVFMDENDKILEKLRKDIEF